MAKILGICGSLRRGSYNLMLLQEAIREFAPDLYGIGDIRFPLYDGDLEDEEGIPESVQTLAEWISKADAVIIATPEYNKSLPGGLKNALDWISRLPENPWTDKPVSIISAAAGRGGGDRSQFALRLALAPFGPLVMNGREVLVSNPADCFDEDGYLTDERARKALTTHIAAFRDLVAACHPVR